jgi:hypothetical protein
MFAWLSRHLFINKLPPDITRKRLMVMRELNTEMTMKPIDRTMTMINPKNG